LSDSKKELLMNISRGVFSIITWLLISLPVLVHGQGYRIEVNLKGLSGDTIILGEYFTTRMIPKDTILLDQKGRGVFEGKEPYAGGLYLVYFRPTHFFDMILGDDQHFTIHTDTSDFVNGVTFEGSEDNRVFMEYKKQLQLRRGEVESIQTQLADAATKADSTALLQEQKKINAKMEAYMNQIESEYPSLFVTEFIGATREPLPPDELLIGDRKYNDSVRFFYYKDHFLDRFDPFNVRLLHTPLYEGKIKNFLTRVTVQHPDSLIAAVDFLLEGARVDNDLYRYMLITLFNHFAESKFMGMDVVYFHIAEKYYIPDASWSSRDFLSKLQENLEKNKPTLIGQTAPNLAMRQIPAEHFSMALEDTIIKQDPHIGNDFFLHDIDARYTILYFWEADCGHCKTATPALQEVHSRLKDKGVEVVSVHVINTIEGKELWVDFVNEHGMYDWINCWSPYSNDFRRLYNLQSYPQLFVLDQEKKIVAKRITPEQAENIIENLIKIDS
jgi:thiol-disulfide isomerase/thioredoxin